MKTETRKQTITTEYDVYIAVDGTEFKTEEECKSYEQSALCVVQERFLQKAVELKINRDETTKEIIHDDMYFALNLLDALMEDGTDQADYYKWTPENETDINNYLQWCRLKFGCKGYPDINENGEDSYFRQFSPRCRLVQLKPGKTYILYVNNECGWVMAYNMEQYVDAIKEMTKVLVG